VADEQGNDLLDRSRPVEWAILDHQFSVGSRTFKRCDSAVTDSGFQKSHLFACVVKESIDIEWIPK